MFVVHDAMLPLSDTPGERDVRSERSSVLMMLIGWFGRTTSFVQPLSGLGSKLHAIAITHP